MNARLLRKLIIFALPIVLFLVVSLQLRLPENHIVAGGDFYQLLNYSSQLSRYRYAWFNQVGQGTYNPLVVSYPFYALLAAFEKPFGTNNIAAITLFVFLSSSYLSFYLAMKLLLKDKSASILVLSSTIYALNNFVLAIFSYTWGYTHHFLIYIFIPLYLAIFIRILTEKKMFGRYLALFLIVIVLSLPAMNNIAFIFLVYFVELLIWLVTILKVKSLKAKTISLTRFSTLIIFQLCIHGWLILPMVTSIVLAKSNALSSSVALGGQNYLESWIASTSSNFINTLTLTLDNYKFPNVSTSSNPLYLLSVFIYPLLLLLLKLFSKDAQTEAQKNNFFIAATVFTVVSILSVRLYQPLQFLLKPLYLSPIFIFFRSSDKLFLVLPFFYSFLIYLLSIRVRYAKYLLLLTVGLISIPWLISIPRYFLEADYNRFARKIHPQYSYIVSVPDQYYLAAKTVNDDPVSDGAILSLPFSVVNSYNWANYPGWNFVGHDILHLLFNRPYISPNSFDSTIQEDSASFKELADKSVSDQQVINTFDRFNVRYLIYHHDIDPYWIDLNAPLSIRIHQLEDQRYLTLVDQNSDFDLYKIQRNPNQIISIASGSLSVHQFSPVLYELETTGKIDNEEIRFYQTYDSGWMLIHSNQKIGGGLKSWIIPMYIIKELLLNNSELNMTHQQCLNYANCWKMTDANDGNVYYLLYVHQLLLYGLLGTSSAMIISALTILAISKK